MSQRSHRPRTVHPPTQSASGSSPVCISPGPPTNDPNSPPATPSTPTAEALKNGIDPGPPLSAKGRAKRTYSKRSDEIQEGDIYRHRFLASHIKRGFDLFGYIPAIINNGIRRRARLEIGESIDGIMSSREYATFEKIMDHLPGLEADIVRYCADPLTFRDLVQSIQESAHNARSNDVSNIKKDLGYLLSDNNSTTPKTILFSCLNTDKSNRGFQDDITGRFLCPVIYDWDDPVDKQKLQDGNYAVTADVFPRLLYADCVFDPDDMESGLGRNMALVRTLRYIFTGRSAAVSATPGSKTTRAGNAQLAGMTRMTPNAIAYGACLLRFALSTTATWCQVDMEFDMEVFYWNIVDIFQDDDQFSQDLLTWWNWQVLGISSESDMPARALPPPKSSMSALKEQRATKRARLSEALNAEGPSTPGINREMSSQSLPASAYTGDNPGHILPSQIAPPLGTSTSSADSAMASSTSPPLMPL